MVSSQRTAGFRKVYESTNGIGGFDVKNGGDRGFAFDYDGSGKLDHLVFYRPGAGAIFILKNSGGNFTPVYSQGDPGDGIGGYDLARYRVYDTGDVGFAFDYDGSRKLDHLVFYRPNTGAIFILKNSGGNFTPVYSQGDPGNGIGGYDLKAFVDKGFSFDYNSSGKLDHLVFYRPGKGAIFIIKNSGGNFTPVYSVGDSGDGGRLPGFSRRTSPLRRDPSPPVTGIGGYDLKSTADQGFAFDYNGSGKLDHLVFYRTGAGAIFILKKSGTKFSPVYSQGDPGNGIGGYDLKAGDEGFAFDYNSSGKLDHLVFYRGGSIESGSKNLLPHTYTYEGKMVFLKNTNGDFTQIDSLTIEKPTPGDAWPFCKAFAFDYNSSGKLDHIVIYRPKQGKVLILGPSL